MPRQTSRRCQFMASNGYYPQFVWHQGWRNNAQGWNGSRLCKVRDFAYSSQQNDDIVSSHPKSHKCFVQLRNDKARNLIHQMRIELMDEWDCKKVKSDTQNFTYLWQKSGGGGILYHFCDHKVIFMICGALVPTEGRDRDISIRETKPPTEISA